MQKWIIGIAFLLCVASAAVAQMIGGGSSAGGGSSTLTANSTATSGYTAGQIVYSDGSKIQAGIPTISSVGQITLTGAQNNAQLLTFDSANARPTGMYQPTLGGLGTSGLVINNGASMIGIGTNTSGSAPFWGNPLIIPQNNGLGGIGFVDTEVRGNVNPDVGISRNAAGVLEINNGSSVSVSGALAALKATTATFTTLASDATHTDATVCADSTSGLLYKGSGTLGICLGTSSARFKHDIIEHVEGLDSVLALKPVSYRYNKGYGNDGERELYGFLAEDVNNVLPKLVGPDENGKPNSVDYVGLIPVLVKAVQEQQKTIDCLRQQKQGC